MKAQLLIQKLLVINQDYLYYLNVTARYIQLSESKWPNGCIYTGHDGALSTSYCAVALCYSAVVLPGTNCDGDATAQ